MDAQDGTMTPITLNEVVLSALVVTDTEIRGRHILTLPERACHEGKVVEELVAPLRAVLWEEVVALGRERGWELRGGQGKLQPTPGMRVCKQCKKRFWCMARCPPQLKRCSGACIEASKLARRGAWVKRRAVQRSERRDGKRCEHCGEAVEAKRATRRYCSDRCRVAAFRAPVTVTLEELGLLER